MTYCFKSWSESYGTFSKLKATSGRIFDFDFSTFKSFGFFSIAHFDGFSSIMTSIFSSESSLSSLASTSSSSSSETGLESASFRKTFSDYG